MLSHYFSPPLAPCPFGCAMRRGGEGGASFFLDFQDFDTEKFFNSKLFRSKPGYRLHYFICTVPYRGKKKI